jgi:hypothetical protein
MRSLNIKRIVGISALSAFAMLAIASAAPAQRTWNGSRDSGETQRQTEKQRREQARQQERLRLQRERLARQNRNHNDRNVVVVRDQNAGRYRIYRNGAYYNTDNRGAELLRQAVNNGYRQGYEAGRMDRSNRRGSQWSRNEMYRTGEYGYDPYVDRGQYQYYFQQGFQKGYDDGYYTRNRYGTYNNGSASILGNILGTILNIQSY